MYIYVNDCMMNIHHVYMHIVLIDLVNKELTILKSSANTQCWSNNMIQNGFQDPSASQNVQDMRYLTKPQKKYRIIYSAKLLYVSQDGPSSRFFVAEQKSHLNVRLSSTF